MGCSLHWKCLVAHLLTNKNIFQSTKHIKRKRGPLQSQSALLNPHKTQMDPKSRKSVLDLFIGENLVYALTCNLGHLEDRSKVLSLSTDSYGGATEARSRQNNRCRQCPRDSVSCCCLLSVCCYTQELSFISLFSSSEVAPQNLNYPENVPTGQESGWSGMFSVVPWSLGVWGTLETQGS